MEFFNNHKKLFGTALLLFVGLSVFVAIIPAVRNQNDNAPLPGSEALSGDALAGKHVFISEGCVACHSQQVRNVDMDKVWGARPGVAADYANSTRMNWWMNTATLMGTERTGPDLTDIGNRLPSSDWHLLHLYNPRSVVDKSIMPAYPWLFQWKANPAENEKMVSLPEGIGSQGKSLVARKEALQLVAYLQSLKQTPLPDGVAAPEFLYEADTDQSAPQSDDQLIKTDGARLYARNCQACHQADGAGLKGAFPPLKASPIVLDDNPGILIEIIMRGYDGREEYGAMPAVGANNGLTAAEVTALINHERTSWGNNARVIPLEEVKRILEQIENVKPKL
jgi:cytochrome c oxidase cbb3-type subunit II